MDLWSLLITIFTIVPFIGWGIYLMLSYATIEDDTALWKKILIFWVPYTMAIMSLVAMGNGYLVTVLLIEVLISSAIGFGVLWVHLLFIIPDIPDILRDMPAEIRRLRRNLEDFKESHL